MPPTSDILVIISAFGNMVVMVLAAWRLGTGMGSVKSGVDHVTKLVNSRDTERNAKIDALIDRNEKLLDANTRLQTLLTEARHELDVQPETRRRWGWKQGEK